MYKKITALFVVILITTSLFPPITNAYIDGSFKITFYIRGYGHGVGMSMAGVYGMARKGYRYNRIAEHYYPYTRWSRINDNTRIQVWCSTHNRKENFTVRSYLYRLAEEPDSWPREGLRTTMVAARTYLWYKVKKHGYMTGGQYFICTLSPSRRPNIVKAVNDTSGRILTYGGSPIVAAYSSSAGGATAAYQDTWPGGSTFRYLRRVSSPYDKYVRSTYYYTRVKTVRQIESAYPDIGHLNNMKVIRRNGFGAWGGRVLKVRLYGTSKTKDINGWPFVQKMGLRSSLFTFRGLSPSRITMRPSKWTAPQNTSIRINGYVYPKHNNHLVYVYIYAPSGARYSRKVRLYGRWSKGSKYTYVVLLRETGIYKFRTKFVGSTTHMPRTSGFRYVTVN